MNELVHAGRHGYETNSKTWKGKGGSVMIPTIRSRKPLRHRVNDSKGEETYTLTPDDEFESEGGTVTE